MHRLVAVTVVLALAHVGPGALATGSYSHQDAFALGGAAQLQEIHQYRLTGLEGQVLTAQLTVLDVADLDLLLFRETGAGCTAFACGAIVAHRMAAFDEQALITIELPADGTYIVEVEGWVATPGTAYRLDVSLDGEAPAVAGPEPFIMVTFPAFYLHKSEDVLDQL